jgi:DNA-binding response OmpR family regulator
MTILLIDDDRTVTLLISTKLQRLGFDVVVAHDAMQGFMQATRCNPDAIILDINMPGGNGIEVLRKFKSSSKTSSVPVIILSGSQKSSDQTELMSMGASAFVYKSTAMHRVEAILLSCLPKSFRPVNGFRKQVPARTPMREVKSIRSLSNWILGSR